MLTVFIVDDEYRAITRLQDLLSSIDCIDIVGTACSYEEAVHGILAKHPDLVFMDVEIRDRTGFEVVKAVNDAGMHPKVIFATGHHQYAVKALRSKAIDYLLKPIDVEELHGAINRMLEDSSQNVEDTVFKSIHKKDLSQRESQILERVCKGMSSQEIANELYLSVHTIDTYRRKLLKRFDVRNTTELVSVMLQSLMHQS